MRRSGTSRHRDARLSDPHVQTRHKKVIRRLFIALYEPSFASTGSSGITSVASSSVRTSVVFAMLEPGVGDGEAGDEEVGDPVSCATVGKDDDGGDGEVDRENAVPAAKSLFN